MLPSNIRTMRGEGYIYFKQGQTDKRSEDRERDIMRREKKES